MKTVYLYVEYPAKLYPEYDDIIDKIVGTECDGSGIGFGIRDLSYTITEHEYNLAKEKLKLLEPKKSCF